MGKSCFLRPNKKPHTRNCDLSTEPGKCILANRQTHTHTYIYTSTAKIARIPTTLQESYFFWNSRNSPVVPVNSRNTRKFSQFSAFCPFSLFFHVYFIFHHHSRANVSRTSCTGHICPMNRSFDMFWVILFR